MMDRVGNTRGTAKTVALDARGNFQFRDAVGGRDSNDYYRLRLNRSSSLNISLAQLRSNANLELLSRSGGVLQRSSKSGTRSESIRKTLAPGTYYLRVYPGSQQSTTYVFRLSASSLPNIDTPTQPEPPPSVNPPSTPVYPLPTTKFLNVNSPNGGNQFTSGSNLSINWTDNFSENVRIELYQGNIFTRNIAASTASDGIFNWLVPSNLPGRSDYKLKITSVNDSRVTDFSDVSFSILPSVSSNQWRAEFFNRTSENYNLNNWGVNGSTYKTGLAQVTQNLGSNNSAGTIKARLYRHYEHNSPVAGINSNYYAMWATTRMYLEVGRQYQIATDSDDGTAFYLKPSSSSTTRFLGDDWRDRSIAEDTKLIPFTVSQSGYYDFGLKYFEGIGGSIIDVTVTELQTPSIRVTSPNGGNSFTTGSSYNINWTDNISENVRIDLYRGSTFDRTITTSTFSDGSYSWLVPTNLSSRSDYRLKISSTQNSNIADWSDSSFSIIASLPDLVVQNASAPTSATAGSSITVSAYTKNNGNSLAGASYVRYWLSNDTTLDSSDRSLGTDYVNSLSAGASELDSLTLTYNTSWGTGTKYILFEADGYKYVSESNETNNVTSRAINVVAPLPDLVVQSVSVPTSITAGNTMSISAYTNNIGGSTAGSSYIRYWLSNNTTLDSSDRSLGTDYVNSLSAGASELDSLTLTYDTSWGTGTKYILFEADGYKYVSESNETNNVTSRAITVHSSPSTPTTYQSFDANKVFSLHSNVGANHTIYLDLNGHITTNTAWNTRYGRSSIVTPAYDADGNSSSFSTTERQTIWEIWRRVAEDFIPFNVNVTTAAPPTSDLVKTDSSDTRWGIRVAIGGNDDDWYTGSAGGVAYKNSFNYSTDTPAFAFQNFANQSAKAFAEIVSHEVGHALGLSHDGDATKEYYEGHGSGNTGWASIMGVGYSKNLTQWGKGEYSGATNQEDDLSIITTRNGFGYRTDDYGGSRSSAASLLLNGFISNTYGIIERNTDEDWFTFNSSTGRISLSINPFEHGPNLDIMAMIYNSSGALVATSNPFSELSASFNGSYSPGQYYIRILGTGKSGVDGYTKYGSLGQYSITGSIA